MIKHVLPAIIASAFAVVATWYATSGARADAERWRTHCEIVELQYRGLLRMETAQRERFEQYSTLPDQWKDCRVED